MTSVQFKKFVFSLLLSLVTLGVHAQFVSASVGINGLTCSQCSRSVEMQLRKLPFVKDVDMNLEQTEGRIVFRENKKVDIAGIAKAVKDAGFSVRFLKARVKKSSVQLSDQGCFSYNGNSYTFLGTSPLPAAEVFNIRFLGKGFSAGNELKNYDLSAKGKCMGRNNYFVIAE
jgi:copper chaperone CopZ